jgi:hypothetical protein
MSNISIERRFLEPQSEGAPAPSEARGGKALAIVAARAELLQESEVASNR